MLKINKVAEPDFLKSYKRKHKPKNWDDYNEDNIKFELKTYIVENEQKINEGSLCVYCEREINVKNNDGHIEHIKPKDKFPQLFQEYNNLSISCNSKSTCGHAKQNEYDSRLINPIEDNPEDFLVYDDLTGKIMAKDISVKNRVEYTVNEVLNLNEYNLCKARKLVIKTLDDASNGGYFDYIADNYKGFYTLINFYRENFIFNQE